MSSIYTRIDSTESIESLAASFSRSNKPLPIMYEGDEKVLRGHLHTMRNQSGEWIGTIAVFRDATREVQAERTRSNLILTVSREVRSSLTLIKGYVELMLEGLEDELRPQQRQLLEIVRSNTERITTVLNNAVEVGRWSRNEVLLEVEPVRVGPIIDESVKRLNSLAKARSLSISSSYPHDLPIIQADPGRLLQVLDNLLSNACRFTPNGGKIEVRAWLETEPLPSNRKGPEYIVIAVSDTGIGINPREHKKIFERYYQVDTSLFEGSESGMGVGLAVVKELVQAHDGRVWLESAVGKGSTFHVALPAKESGRSGDVGRLSPT